MRVAVVGSRTGKFEILERARRYVRTLPRYVIVISGGAEGVDTAAAGEARALGMTVIEHPPDYKRNSQFWAPLARNQEIAEDCDELVAFWDGDSSGTIDVIRRAVRAGKKVTINP